MQEAGGGLTAIYTEGLRAYRDLRGPTRGVETGAEEQGPWGSNWSLCLAPCPCPVGGHWLTPNACPAEVDPDGAGWSQRSMWVLGAVRVSLVVLRGSQAGTNLGVCPPEEEGSGSESQQWARWV